MLFKDFLCIGIAGNFANHLEQAKEINDFVDVKTAEINAPKGIFPIYVPNSGSFVGTYPLSHEKINFLEDFSIQMEPETVLICEIVYDEFNKVKLIKPLKFGAFNDCSIRKEGAKKISEKKNWGECSKGVSENFLELDSFSTGSNIDNFRLASFVKRDGKIFEYGVDSCLKHYSYFHQKLINWIIDKLNNQKNESVLEDFSEILKVANYPKYCLISIGSSAYTDFGETNYLKRGDELFVFIYHEEFYSNSDLIFMIENSSFETENISVLKQIVG